MKLRYVSEGAMRKTTIECRNETRLMDSADDEGKKIQPWVETSNIKSSQFSEFKVS